MAAQVPDRQNTTIDPAIDKLVEQLRKLRNDIAAGTHPRLKISSEKLVNGTSTANNQSSLPNGVNLHAVALNSLSSSVDTRPSTAKNGLQPNHDLKNLPPPDSGAELLREKRRQLERVLEEQLQQKKIMARQRTCDQEIVADFDVSEVLRKAHERVKPFKPQQSKVANRATSSSDSFDENTFYSSQMNSSTTTEEVENTRNWRRPLRVCRFFRDGKPCPYGEKCTFSHDPAVLKKIEANEQDRAAVPHHNRTNEQINRKAPTSPRPPQKASTSHTSHTGIMQDPQVTRIAELEDQLRRLKEQARLTIVPRAVERDEVDNQDRSNYPSRGADEFGRDRTTREEDIQPPKDTNHVHVVRNHITSPYAPQPARVSPLAVTKNPQVSQLQRAYEPIISTSYDSDNNGNVNQQNPGIMVQSPASRKRRRRPDPQEQARNVVPRRQDAVSPVVRIKEEPISPSPYIPTASSRQIQQVPVYINSTPTHPQERIIYQPQDAGRSAQAYEVHERRPITPVARRVLSRNGQHYFTDGEPDLRRVVSAKTLRTPTSPGAYDAQYSNPQPRLTRAASHVQHASPIERPMPIQYRASVQPQARERQSPQPRQVPPSPTRHASVAMPPPARRIVVDQFGNRFMEAPLPTERSISVAPTYRQVDFEQRYEPVQPRDAVLQQSQPVVVDQKGAYVRQEEIPTAPQFIEYPTVPSKRQIIQLDQDYHDLEDYGNGRQYVQYETRHMPHDQITNGIGENNIRLQSVRPAEDRYETVPREALTRVSSVRPQQPRIVSLSDQQEVPSRLIRQVSVRPDDGFARPVQRLQQQEPTYQYLPQEEETRYVEAPQNERMYQQAGNGGKRYLQRM